MAIRGCRGAVIAGRIIRWALAGAVTLSAPLASAEALTVADYPSFYLDRGVLANALFYAEQNPELDGNFVVYQRRNLLAMPPDDVWNIAVRDLQSQTSQFFTLAGSDQTNPDVGGGWIAYQSRQSGNGDIYVRDMRASAGSTAMLVGSGVAAQERPRISPPYVVWKNLVDESLEYHDIRTGLTYGVPESANASHWDVDNGVLVFSVNEAERDTLWMWPIGSMGFPVKVYTTPQVNYPSIVHVRLHGSRAHIEIGGFSANNVLVELRGRVSRQISLPNSSHSRPDVFHSSLVWESSETMRTPPSEIFFFIDGVNSMMDFTSNDDLDFTRPSIFGNRVVYQAGTNGDIWMAADKPRVDRTEGGDRYATAVEISKAYYPDGSPPYTNYTVLLCTGEKFPDALAAAPWAAQMGAPLLLTRRYTVPESVMDEIERLDPARIVIIGGESAVSSTVADSLTLAGYTVENVAGADRYETSKLIAEKYIEQLGQDSIVWDKGVFVARGDAFADALAVGPAAAGAHRPILLTRPEALPQSVNLWFMDVEIEDAIIVGGTGAVSDGVKFELDQHLAWMSSPPAERWDGADRYATAARVASESVDRNWLDLDMIGLATGENFPDALGGGAVCGNYGSPLMLTRRSTVPIGLSDFLADHEYEIGRVDIFGGAYVVNETVRTSVRSQLK